MKAKYPVLLNIIILISLFSGDLFAQGENFILTGKVVDASNNNPVEFANLGVEGTFLGTATDADGNFQLDIDKSYSDYDLVISAVGYQSKKIKLKDLAAGKSHIISLTPAIYKLSEVDIEAQSKILYGIIRSAGNLIFQNYIQGPVELNSFYMSENKADGNKTEAVISLVDNTGYGERSYFDAFTNRSYVVNEIRRNFEILPVEKGATDLDYLLIFDIVRVRGNILDSTALYDFSLNLKETPEYNGDSVWVISYKNSNPSFATTGNNYVKSYSGVIYISKTTSAVLRNELNIETEGYFPYGYTAFYDDEISSDSVSTAKFEVVTTYGRNADGKYLLNSIDLEKTLMGNDGNKSVSEESIKVIKAKQNGVSPLNRRQYFSDRPLDKKFWDSFTIPAD